jgi:acetyl esterase/lipase
MPRDPLLEFAQRYATAWCSQDAAGLASFYSADGTLSVNDNPPAVGRGAIAEVVAPIYAGGEISQDVPVPADAPPMFIAAATDDQLGLAPESVALYQRWTGAHKSAELHLYAKGGHGFGMRKQNLPTDHWIDRFAEWMELQGWLKK